MKLDPKFIALTFVFVIIIILMAESITTAMAIIAVVASFLALLINLHKVKNASTLDISMVGMKKPTPASEASATDAPVGDTASVSVLGGSSSGSQTDLRASADSQMQTGLSRAMSEYTEASPAPYKIYGPATSYNDQDPNMYGNQYKVYDSYHNAYSACYPPVKPAYYTSCSENDSSLDARVALIGQKRARDRKCSDGWASKTSDYYKYHYADELDQFEQKPWWGNSEY